MVSPDVGGGFGYKGKNYPEEAIVAWAARRSASPREMAAAPPQFRRPGGRDGGMKKLSAPEQSAEIGTAIATQTGWIQLAVGLALAAGLVIWLWRSFRAEAAGEADAD